MSNRRHPAELPLVASLLRDPAGTLAATDGAAALPGDLGDLALRSIAAAALRLRARGDAVDGTSVAAELRAVDLLGRDEDEALVRLEDYSSAPPAASLATYARLIGDAAKVRRLREGIDGLKALSEQAGAAHDDIRDELSRLLASTPAGADAGTVLVGAELTTLAMRPAERPATLDTSLPWIKLRRGGGRPTVVAARPGTGKTAFAINNVLLPNRLAGRSCVMFACEMDAVAVERFQLVALTGRTIREVDALLDGGQPSSDLTAAADRLLSDTVAVDARPAPSSAYIRQRTLDFADRFGSLDLVIVDHIGLMTHPRDGRGRLDLAMAESVHALRELQKETGCAVVILSQLNRGLENREEKRPRAADLRECGALEEDAGLALGIYRPVVHDSTADPTLAEFHIWKDRNGGVGMRRARFDPSRLAFVPPA